MHWTKSKPSKGWLEDVLERSRFDFEHEELEGVDVYVAGEITSQEVLNGTPSSQGWVRLTFKHGPIVGIDLQSLKATKEKQSAFVHHLALSMLPPLLTSIVDIDAMWVPNGWDLDDSLPTGAQEGLEKLMAGWHGLTVPEGNLTRACERAVLDSLDFGLLIGSSWSKGDSIEHILASLEDMQGSQDEKLLAAGVFLEAMERTEEGIRIDARGGRQEREGSIVEVMEGASLTDAVHALWEDFGLAGLTSIGIEDVEDLWEDLNQALS